MALLRTMYDFNGIEIAFGVRIQTQLEHWVKLSIMVARPLLRVGPAKLQKFDLYKWDIGRLNELKEVLRLL